MNGYDTDSTTLADLLAGWEEIDPPGPSGSRGCTIAQALKRLREDDGGKRYQRIRSALGELCPHPPGQLPTARKVGYALRRFRGRVVGGLKMLTRIAAGNNLWLVQHVGALEQEENAASQLSLLENPERSPNEARSE